MKTTRKKVPAPAPDHFFGDFLAGEEPVTISTARSLVQASNLLQELEPWELIEETNLVFCGKESGEPLSMCSVIGALGESFALFAYIGGSSYYQFRDLQEDLLAPEEFFASQHSVRVEFEEARRLTKPDRELLAATGYKAAPGELRPMFRTIRPHYHAWYPNETEARLLAISIGAFLSLFKGETLPDYWMQEGVYPLVELEGLQQNKARVFLLRPPKPIIEIPPVEIDSEKLRRILARNHRRGGALEADCFHMPSRIGAAKERPMWLRVAVAVDANTGIAYPPQMVEAKTDSWTATAAALYTALESGAAIPEQIFVSNPMFEESLQPLAAALGSKLVRRKHLPAIEGLRTAMINHFAAG